MKYPDGGLVFKNTYDAKGSVTLEGTKKLTGKTLVAGEYSFTVEDKQGNTVTTGTNKDDGTITFSPISYRLKDAGVHTYTVTEVNGGRIIDNTTYSAQRYTINVTVSDNGDGTLKVTTDDNAKKLDFTNSVEKTSVSVKKIWDDNDNQDGKRPESIKVQLYANGDAFGDAVELNAKNGWSTDWQDLDKYKDGKEVEYTVKELEVPDDYSFAISGNASDGFIITNTHQPETVDIAGTKTWSDSNNQDGKRPDSITIRLLADGVEKDSKTVTAADGWKYSFTDLPKYVDGNEITYTITEDAVPDYTTTYSGLDVTNSYKPGKTSVTVTKAWDDSSNQDGKRPSSIEVQLYADGSAKGDKVTLNDSNKWTYTWTDLDEKKDGKNIAYTVQEVKVPDGYTSSITGDATKGYTITNSYKTQTVDISGTKIWSDQNNQYGVRPDSITIRLWKNGTEIRSTTISGAKDAATWSYSFTGLPKYENGKEITYTVTEDAVAGYTTSISGYTITNSYAPNLVTIQGTKTWDDDNNADGLRPSSIVVNLLADGTAVQRQQVKAAADGTWTYSFVNLPSMANGKKITYTVTEDPVPGYTATINGYNIINTHRAQKIDIPVTKVWAGGASATSVEVELVANGTATGNKLTLSAATDWKGTFTGLDQYAADGSEITYTVQENTKGFNTTIAGSAAAGFVITNSAIEANVTELHLHKYWADSDDVDHFRPTSVTVQIYADGAPYGNAVTLSVDNNWTYDLTGIPAEQDGHAINYTVEEVSVPDHYTVLVDTVGTNAYNITNIRKENGTWGVNDGTGDTFSVLGASRTRNVKGANRDRNTETTENVEGTRRARTGDNLPYGNLAATAAATAVLVGWGISRRKKKNQKDNDSKD